MGRLLIRLFSFFLFAAFFFILPCSLDAQTSYDWAFSPGDKIEESSGRGLVIRSNPSSANVFIDGIARGITPLRLDDMRPGRYRVELRKEGYLDRRFLVSVRAGSVVDVSVELEAAIGRVLLKIKAPAGVQSGLPLTPTVTVDGVQYPGEALELPEGFRTILVRAFGYSDVSETLYVGQGTYRELDIQLLPAPFKISAAAINRQSFNPGNAGSLGTVSLGFDVSGPGKASFTVINMEGKMVHTQLLGPFASWSQSAVWNGRSIEGEILEDGTYTLVLKAVSVPPDNSPQDNSLPEEDSFSLTVELDSSRLIYPLTLSSGKSGLTFAPLPVLLPPLSFQLEGSLMAGSPPESGGAWKSLPFAAAFRFSPLEKLELSAALNVIPRFGGEAGAGIGAGAKWAYLNGGTLPLRAAAGLVFAWEGKTAVTPFGMASGIEVFFPFMLDMGNFFSLALSPAALWTSSADSEEGGFPWEGAPRLLASAALLARMSYALAGLSVRTEYIFKGGQPWPPRLMAAAEAKIFPPPSSFVLSLSLGVWKRDGDFGGFGGLGIGMIH